MTEEQKIKKPVWKKWWFWVVAVIILAAVANRGGNGAQNSGGSTGSSAKTSTPQIPLPNDQKEFVSIVNESKSEYKAQPNELKKSAVRTKRGELLKKALADSYQIKDWIGIIDQMKTTGDGNAILILKIENESITIQTTNNEFSNKLGDNSLIPQSSELFKVIAELAKGDRVKFSGTFTSSSDNDFIKEMSLTESGSMDRPTFMFSFDKVAKM